MLSGRHNGDRQIRERTLEQSPKDNGSTSFFWSSPEITEMSVFQDSVTYLCHILDKEGVRPHLDKVKAITAMPDPQNQSELRSFLGMVQYYDRFIPGLATNCAVLNNLLQKNFKWTWKPDHAKAVETVKTSLTSADTLTHYDPSLPLSLACDASPVGRVGGNALQK